MTTADPFWSPPEGSRLAATVREARARIDRSDYEPPPTVLLVVLDRCGARTVVVPPAVAGRVLRITEAAR